MLRETDEIYHQMNLEDYFDSQIKPNLFAVSRIFAEARKQMTLSEYKMFAYALTSVKWKDKCPDILYLDKKEVAQIVGITESDASDLSQHLRRSVGNLAKHSYLEFSDKASGAWANGFFVTSVAFFKNRLRIRMNQDYLPLFGELERGYITMWSGDIFKLRSERAVKLYEVLRENSDTRQKTQTGTISIKFLKELFGIPKDGKGSYVRQNGHFSRPEFEKYVIDPVCEDLAHTEMLQLVIQPGGKFYEKVKRGNRVIAYRLCWTLSSHPRVASAAEVREIQEKVDKNPEILKVAKDIVKGQKKPKQHKQQPDELPIGGFVPRDTDLDALAEKLQRESAYEYEDVGSEGDEKK